MGVLMRRAAFGLGAAAALWASGLVTFRVGVSRRLINAVSADPATEVASATAGDLTSDLHAPFHLNPRIAAMFTSLDADNDGSLEFEEVVAPVWAQVEMARSALTLQAVSSLLGFAIVLMGAAAGSWSGYKAYGAPALAAAAGIFHFAFSAVAQWDAAVGYERRAALGWAVSLALLPVAFAACAMAVKRVTEGMEAETALRKRFLSSASAPRAVLGVVTALAFLAYCMGSSTFRAAVVAYPFLSLGAWLPLLDLTSNAHGLLSSPAAVSPANATPAAAVGRTRGGALLQCLLTLSLAVLVYSVASASDVLKGMLTPHPPSATSNGTNAPAAASASAADLLPGFATVVSLAEGAAMYGFLTLAAATLSCAASFNSAYRGVVGAVHVSTALIAGAGVAALSAFLSFDADVASATAHGLGLFVAAPLIVAVSGTSRVSESGLATVLAVGGTLDVVWHLATHPFVAKAVAAAAGGKDLGGAALAAMLRLSLFTPAGADTAVTLAQYVRVAGPSACALMSVLYILWLSLRSGETVGRLRPLLLNAAGVLLLPPLLLATPFRADTSIDILGFSSPLGLRGAAFTVGAFCLPRLLVNAALEAISALYTGRLGGLANGGAREAAAWRAASEAARLAASFVTASWALTASSGASTLRDVVPLASLPALLLLLSFAVSMQGASVATAALEAMAGAANADAAVESPLGSLLQMAAAVTMFATMAASTQPPFEFLFPVAIVGSAMTLLLLHEAADGARSVEDLIASLTDTKLRRARVALTVHSALLLAWAANGPTWIASGATAGWPEPLIAAASTPFALKMAMHQGAFVAWACLTLSLLPLPAKRAAVAQPDTAVAPAAAATAAAESESASASRSQTILSIAYGGCAAALLAITHARASEIAAAPEAVRTVLHLAGNYAIVSLIWHVVVGTLRAPPASANPGFLGFLRHQISVAGGVLAGLAACLVCLVVAARPVAAAHTAESTLALARRLDGEELPAHILLLLAVAAAEALYSFATRMSVHSQTDSACAGLFIVSAIARVTQAVAAGTAALPFTVAGTEAAHAFTTLSLIGSSAYTIYIVMFCAGLLALGLYGSRTGRLVAALLSLTLFFDEHVMLLHVDGPSAAAAPAAAAAAKAAKGIAGTIARYRAATTSLASKLPSLFPSAGSIAVALGLPEPSFAHVSEAHFKLVARFEAADELRHTAAAARLGVHSIGTSLYPLVLAGITIFGMLLVHAPAKAASTTATASAAPAPGSVGVGRTLSQLSRSLGLDAASPAPAVTAPGHSLAVALVDVVYNSAHGLALTALGNILDAPLMVLAGRVSLLFALARLRHADLGGLPQLAAAFLSTFTLAQLRGYSSSPGVTVGLCAAQIASWLLLDAGSATGASWLSFDVSLVAMGTLELILGAWRVLLSLRSMPGGIFVHLLAESLAGDALGVFAGSGVQRWITYAGLVHLGVGLAAMVRTRHDSRVGAAYALRALMAAPILDPLTHGFLGGAGATLGQLQVGIYAASALAFVRSAVCAAGDVADSGSHALARWFLESLLPLMAAAFAGAPAGVFTSLAVAGALAGIWRFVSTEHRGRDGQRSNTFVLLPLLAAQLVIAIPHPMARLAASVVAPAIVGYCFYRSAPEAGAAAAGAGTSAVQSFGIASTVAFAGYLTLQAQISAAFVASPFGCALLTLAPGLIPAFTTPFTDSVVTLWLPRIGVLAAYGLLLLLARIIRAHDASQASLAGPALIVRMAVGILPYFALLDSGIVSAVNALASTVPPLVVFGAVALAFFGKMRVDDAVLVFGASENTATTGAGAAGVMPRDVRVLLYTALCAVLPMLFANVHGLNPVVDSALLVGALLVIAAQLYNEHPAASAVVLAMARMFSLDPYVRVVLLAALLISSVMDVATAGADAPRRYGAAIAGWVSVIMTPVLMGDVASGLPRAFIAIGLPADMVTACVASVVHFAPFARLLSWVVGVSAYYTSFLAARTAPAGEDSHFRLAALATSALPFFALLDPSVGAFVEKATARSDPTGSLIVFLCAVAFFALKAAVERTLMTGSGAGAHSLASITSHRFTAEVMLGVVLPGVAVAVSTGSYVLLSAVWLTGWTAVAHSMAPSGDSAGAACATDVALSAFIHEIAALGCAHPIVRAPLTGVRLVANFFAFDDAHLTAPANDHASHLRIVATSVLTCLVTAITPAVVAAFAPMLPVGLVASFEPILPGVSTLRLHAWMAAIACAAAVAAARPRLAPGSAAALVAGVAMWLLPYAAIMDPAVSNALQGAGLAPTRAAHVGQFLAFSAVLLIKAAAYDTWQGLPSGSVAINWAVHVLGPLVAALLSGTGSSFLGAAWWSGNVATAVTVALRPRSQKDTCVAIGLAVLAALPVVDIDNGDHLHTLVTIATAMLVIVIGASHVRVAGDKLPRAVSIAALLAAGWLAISPVIMTDAANTVIAASSLRQHKSAIRGSGALHEWLLAIVETYNEPGSALLHLRLGWLLAYIVQLTHVRQGRKDGGARALPTLVGTALALLATLDPIAQSFQLLHSVVPVAAVLVGDLALRDRKPAAALANTIMVMLWGGITGSRAAVLASLLPFTHHLYGVLQAAAKANQLYAVSATALPAGLALMYGRDLAASFKGVLVVVSSTLQAGLLQAAATVGLTHRSAGRGAAPAAVDILPDATLGASVHLGLVIGFGIIVVALVNAVFMAAAVVEAYTAPAVAVAAAPELPASAAPASAPAKAKAAVAAPPTVAQAEDESEDDSAGASSGAGAMPAPPKAQAATAAAPAQRGASKKATGVASSRHGAGASGDAVRA